MNSHRQSLARTSMLGGMFALTAITTMLAARAADDDRDQGSIAGGTFDLSWNTIDGGGGTSSNGGFELSGTIGQPDAGGPMTGGTFSLVGGFWPGFEGPPGCEGDTNNSGAVDADDLVNVILAWGACPLPCPPHCSADVTPFPAGDCLVNADDLVAVILSWGPCP